MPSTLTFADLKTGVQDLSPSQVGDAVSGRAVNRAYQRILRLRPWVMLWKSTTFAPLVDKTAGTITLTRNSTGVVGVGTAFASTDVKRYLRYGSRQPIRITAVADATNLTLGEEWDEPTVAGAAYTLFTLRHVLPSDADRVLRVSGPSYKLERRNLGLIDYFDPTRQQRGTPAIYSEAERVSDLLEVELWPVSSGDETFYLQYRMAVANMTGTQQPVIAPEAIMALGQYEMAMTLFHRTGDQTFLAAAQEAKKEYAEVLDGLIREDRRQRGPQPVALDADDAVNVNDPSTIAFFRRFNTLGLSQLA